MHAIFTKNSKIHALKQTIVIYRSSCGEMSPFAGRKSRIGRRISACPPPWQGGWRRWIARGALAEIGLGYKTETEVAFRYPMVRTRGGQPEPKGFPKTRQAASARLAGVAYGHAFWMESIP